MTLIERVIQLCNTVGADYKALASRFVSAVTDATDADYTAVVNTAIYLPAGTLTVNRTITIPAGANGDRLEFYNNEKTFVWNLAGSGVYLSDGITTVTSLTADTNYMMKKIAGKWRITN